MKYFSNNNHNSSRYYYEFIFTSIQNCLKMLTLVLKHFYFFVMKNNIITGSLNKYKLNKSKRILNK